jgi:hypothetical protein
MLDDVRIYNRALSLDEIAALSNLTEDQPPDPTGFRIASIELAPAGGWTLALNLPATLAVTLERAVNVAGGPWHAVTAFPAASTNRVTALTIPSTGLGGFYRLRSP